MDDKQEQGSITRTTLSRMVIQKYRTEEDLPEIIALISADLSEPYSIYVYRYFIHQWPNLCFVV